MTDNLKQIEQDLIENINQIIETNNKLESEKIQLNTLLEYRLGINLTTFLNYLKNDDLDPLEKIISSKIETKKID